MQLESNQRFSSSLIAVHISEPLGAMGRVCLAGARGDHLTTVSNHGGGGGRDNTSVDFIVLWYFTYTTDAMHILMTNVTHLCTIIA